MSAPTLKTDKHHRRLNGYQMRTLTSGIPNSEKCNKPEYGSEVPVNNTHYYFDRTTPSTQPGIDFIMCFH